MIIFLVTIILTCVFYLIYMLVIRNNLSELRSAPNALGSLIADKVVGLPIDVNLKLYLPIYFVVGIIRK